MTRASAGLAAGVALVTLGASFGGPATAQTRRAEPPARMIERAHDLAAQADALRATDAARAVELAEQAEAASRVFDAAAFAAVGRRGEILGADVDEALTRYRAHRAVVHSAWGRALLAAGRSTEARVVAERALRLAPDASRRVDFAEALQQSGDAAAALRALVDSDSFDRAAIATLERIVDQLGRPSAQAEIDVGRLRRSAHRGAIRLRERPSPALKASLSTGAPLRLDSDAPAVFYYAAGGCVSCSGDLENAGALPSGPPILVAEDEATEVVLRRVANLYRLPSPVLVGGGLRVFGRASGDRWIVVARRGLVVVGLSETSAVRDVVATLARRDLAESLPRVAWNRRDVPGPFTDPAVAPAAAPDSGAALLVGGPGVDGARAEFDAGRYERALERLRAGTLATDGLLPGDRRLNEAVCLSRSGRRREARAILVGVGDTEDPKRVRRELDLAEGAGPARPD